MDHAWFVGLVRFGYLEPELLDCPTMVHAPFFENSYLLDLKQDFRAKSTCQNLQPYCHTIIICRGNLLPPGSTPSVQDNVFFLSQHGILTYIKPCSWLSWFSIDWTYLNLAKSWFHLIFASRCISLPDPRQGSAIFKPQRCCHQCQQWWWSWTLDV